MSDFILKIDENKFLRNYNINDSEKVINFHEKILKQTGAFIPGPWNDDMKNIDNVYIKSGGCFLVIENNIEIIAIGALKIIDKNQAEIKRMRVDSFYQRQGLGQIILDHLILYAKKLSINHLILDTTELQVSAQKFYIKNHFIEYKRKKWNDLIVIFYEKYI